MALTVEVVSSDRVRWEGEASAVSIPTVEGDVGILTDHQPLLAVLRPGKVRITRLRGGDKVEIGVEGGFLSVDQNHVTVVIDPTTEDSAERGAGTE